MKKELSTGQIITEISEDNKKLLTKQIEMLSKKLEENLDVNEIVQLSSVLLKTIALLEG